MNGQEEKQSQKLAGPTEAAAKKGGRWRPVLLLAILLAIQGPGLILDIFSSL